MHPADAPPHRTGYPSLTGIRGLAAAAVFLNHVGYLVRATPFVGEWRAIRPVSITGVICFFVLSGFLLSQPGSLRGGLKGFWRRRAARILPVYWLILVLSAAFIGVSDPNDPRLDVGNVALNVVLLQSWSPHGQDASINLPSWSLSVEALFYVLLPLLLPALTRWFGRAPMASLAVLGGLGVIGSLSIQLGLVVDTFPPAYLPIFLLGAHAAVTRRAHLPLRWASVVAVLCIATYPVIHNYLLPAVAFMLLIAALADQDRTVAPTWLARPVFQRFGEWSYAFFLVHVLVIGVAAYLLQQPPTNVVVAVAACIVTFGLSWVCAAAIYRIVEEPMRLRLSARQPSRV